MKTKIKICCIKSLKEATMARSYGADFLGVVGPMPSGPGCVDIPTASQIVKSLPPGTRVFYLTSQTNLDGIKSEVDAVNPSHLQITDHIDFNILKELKSFYPKLNLVQVVHVTDSQSISLAKQYGQYADFLLLDSGMPTAQTKLLGGTGKTHDWEISRQIVQQVEIPVFLAGGINASNIKMAIQTVQPYGIDLCSGVRSDDKLDESKLKSLFAELNSF